jgi:hypothetical protein
MISIKGNTMLETIVIVTIVILTISLLFDARKTEFNLSGKNANKNVKHIEFSGLNGRPEFHTRLDIDNLEIKTDRQKFIEVSKKK